MAGGYSLKTRLFNAQSVAQLAGEYAAVLPRFDAAAFQRRALAGLDERSLLACIDWLADCLEPYLARDFPTMADQLEAAMPPMLDPARTDDDFGQFIHAVPGVLAVRYGLDGHCARALDLIHAATKRFSMEFYIRPFLQHCPRQSFARLVCWAEDDNYHVRRLVSEGTRPRLPWAAALDLAPGQTLPLLDRLHADRSRAVTRSVANHLNDISKTRPDLVLARLAQWRERAVQDAGELGWIERHALRTLIRQGDRAALAYLGFRRDAKLAVTLALRTPRVVIGEMLDFEVRIDAPDRTPVLVDYRIGFHRPGKGSVQKVFKLRQGSAGPGAPLIVTKRHRMRGDATTFRLHPGPHCLTLQVNGADRATATFDVQAADTAPHR